MGAVKKPASTWETDRDVTRILARLSKVAEDRLADVVARRGDVWPEVR